MNDGMIPEKLCDYNVYSAGERKLGIEAEVTLPNFESLTTEVSGAGILGTYESPNTGHFGSLELPISFRTVSRTAAELFEPKVQAITLRADQNSYDVVNGVEVHRALKVVTRGRPKGLDSGKAKAGDPTGTKINLELHYILIQEEGVTLVELDKFNYIFIVNGTDYLKEVRKNIF